MFPLLASLNEFTTPPTEVPYDSSYKSCLQGIHAKQITTENIYKSTPQQWHSHQWMWRLNHHLQMFPVVTGYKARFTTVSLLHPNKANKSGLWATPYFRFCWSNKKKKGWKPIKPRMYSQRNAMVEWNSLSHINKCIKWNEIYDLINKMHWYLMNNLSDLLEQHMLHWEQPVKFNKDFHDKTDFWNGRQLTVQREDPNKEDSWGDALYCSLTISHDWLTAALCDWFVSSLSLLKTAVHYRYIASSVMLGLYAAFTLRVKNIYIKEYEYILNHTANRHWLQMR
jgi:hypothetical protein